MAPRKKKDKEIVAFEPPARTVEGRERQMINLTIDAVEKQLREGTASPSVLVHYLKLASTREQLERERLIRENDYVKAKTESLAAAENFAQKYEAAVKAIGIYAGRDDE